MPARPDWTDRLAGPSVGYITQWSGVAPLIVSGTEVIGPSLQQHRKRPFVGIEDGSFAIAALCLDAEPFVE